MLFRSLFAMVIVAIIIKLEGGLAILKTRRPALHFLRGGMLVFANMFFFLGLASMPFAETVALFFTAPLFICLLSQPVLGEKVDATRWMVILLGLGGVIIMLRPGAEVFRLTSFLPVFAALCYAGMQMMTRKLGMADKAGTLTFYIQLAFILISSIVGMAIGDGRFNSANNQTLDFLLRAWSWPELGRHETTHIMRADGFTGRLFIIAGLPYGTGCRSRTIRVFRVTICLTGRLLSVG